MRPGKPLMLGRLGAMRVLGLPGNPVSAMSARCFPGAADPQAVRPRRREPQPLDATLGRDLPANDQRARIICARPSPRAARRAGRDPFRQPGQSLLGAARPVPSA